MYLGEVVCVCSINQLNGIDSTTKTVYLLVGITNKYPWTGLVTQDIQHSCIHVTKRMAFVMEKQEQIKTTPRCVHNFVKWTFLCTFKMYVYVCQIYTTHLMITHTVHPWLTLSINNVTNTIYKHNTHEITHIVHKIAHFGQKRGKSTPEYKCENKFTSL